ncbi:hypothetical protein K7X08_015537 [Anisodus acutangulus]|uniref:Transposase n=1 Tax=Anisodus acutangulus TaxID=402998 RepID=A0A9Q1L5T2_9SOLA|nr:hypothetical protein K7X08_015537 [Anisodus acutangulus]
MAGDKRKGKTKCWWKPEHEALVAQNFEKKAGNILKHVLRRARINNLRPRWICDDSWQELLHYWATDQKFLKHFANAKAAKASENGGSLHTSGATAKWM